MLVSINGDLLKLPTEDVLFFRADEKYIFAVTPRQTLKFESSLDALEREFPGQFWRVHRKYLVKGGAVRGLVKIDGALFLDVSGALDPIPVSRRELPAVRKLFRAQA